MNGYQESLMFDAAPIVNPTILIEKRCTKCLIIKSLLNYSADQRSKDGKRSACKKCSFIENKKWAFANRDKTRSYCKRWAKDNKEHDYERHKKYKARNPEKVKIWRNNTRLKMNRRPLTDEEYEHLKEHVKCKYQDCYCGLGLCGLGRCAAAGQWDNPDCPQYQSYDDYEAEQARRARDN